MTEKTTRGTVNEIIKLKLLSIKTWNAAISFLPIKLLKRGNITPAKAENRDNNITYNLAAVVKYPTSLSLLIKPR